MSQVEIGATFGRLTVIGKRHAGRAGWRLVCRCECGGEVERYAAELRNGKYLSCRKCNSGFLLPKANLIGQTFGQLTVVSKIASSRRGSIWECQCSCGGTAQCTTGHLRQRPNPACSSCRPEQNKGAQAKVFEEQNRLYGVWSGMHSRCVDKTNTSFEFYGAKGIRVSDTWTQFSPFYAWAISHGYAKGLEIDRVDSGGHYTPENCRWIEKAENIRRSRASKRGSRPGVFEPAITGVLGFGR